MKAQERSTARPGTALGAILVSTGALTPKVLRGALQLQGMLQDATMLGEFLVSKGIITKQQLQQGLRIQATLRALGKVRASRVIEAADAAIARAKTRSNMAIQKRIERKSVEIAEAAKKFTGPILSVVAQAGK